MHKDIVSYRLAIEEIIVAKHNKKGVHSLLFL